MYHQPDQHQIHQGTKTTTGQGPTTQHTTNQQNQLDQPSRGNGTSYKTSGSKKPRCLTHSSSQKTQTITTYP